MPGFGRDNSDPFGSSSSIDISDDDLPFYSKVDRKGNRMAQQRGGRKRRKVDYIAANHIEHIDYKDMA